MIISIDRSRGAFLSSASPVQETNAVGMQSLYTDMIRGVYAPNAGDNEKVYWHIADSITGSNRNLNLTLSAIGTAGHILIKYVNIVA